MKCPHCGRELEGISRRHLREIEKHGILKHDDSFYFRSLIKWSHYVCPICKTGGKPYKFFMLNKIDDVLYEWDIDAYMWCNAPKVDSTFVFR